MYHYRVGLWLENTGEIPDVYFELRTNAGVTVDKVVALAILALGCFFVRQATVEVLAASFPSVAVSAHVRTHVVLNRANLLSMHYGGGSYDDPETMRHPF